MRVHSLAFLVTFAFALPLLADGPLEPADYMKIMNDSKITYVVNDKPARHPIEEPKCPRRDESTRLVNGELVAWNVKPDALKLLQDGEELFQANKFDEAAVKYKAALAIDPEAVSGYYFLGDTFLFGSHDPASALEQYRKGLALDPTMPSGHYFSVTAYLELHKPAEAREELIKALALYPSYENAWKRAAQPEYFEMRPVVRHQFTPPPGFVGKRENGRVEIYPGTSAEWLGYAMCRAVWDNEDRFKEHRSTPDGYSLDEERACVLNQLVASYNITSSKLQEEAAKRGVDTPVAQRDILAALPSLDQHLWDVVQSNLLDGYVLFEIIGQKCPIGISALDEPVRKQVEDYVRKYVIVAK